MHDNRAILEKRIERTLRERIIASLYSTVGQLRVRAWRRETDGEPIAEPVQFADLPLEEFIPFAVGETWGMPWETTWFEFTAEIPADDSELRDGDRLEALVDLGWDDHSPGFQAEGLVRDSDGSIIKGLNPRNQWIPLPQPGEAARTSFYVEAAANPLILATPPFQPTADGDKLTSSHADLYRLARADLVVRRHDVYHLSLDLAVLRELASTLPDDDAHMWRLLHAMNDALDALDLDDIAGTAAAARAILRPYLDQPAYPNAHRLSAIGHAHIDSAWLWPIRETRRKVTRTIANVVRLIEDGTGLIFALPAAQHVAWLEEEDPDLFERVKRCVADGSIVPVGGMWVEPDAVLPGGEALCRQLVEGMGYFRDKFGVECEEIWLPDSFGYSAAIPQIARLAGLKHFLTQKISWNQVDTFPHHTLAWEGLDGTRIFTHFPPVDTYGAEVTGDNLAHAEKNFKDKGRANCSMLPFGFGDGGGGPTREMIERIDRFSDLAAAPTVQMETPHTFFARAEADYPNPPVWVGELYLELHRGTFTSQIKTKQGNRRSESLLREAELWAATATVRGVFDYPYEELQDAWRKVLLCQFHDILPGTSVAWVYREVDALYQEVEQTCERIITAATKALASGKTATLANATSFSVSGVAPLGAAAPAEQEPVTVNTDERVLDNGLVRAEFDDTGACISLIDLESGWNVIPAGQRAGELHLHQDFPNMWDAWDLDPFYRGSLQVIDDREFHGVAEDNGVGTASFTARFGKSTATLTWSLKPGARQLDLHVDLDWHEKEKILKCAFPIDIHTDHAQYETQMGYVTRPTHENTSWDAYKFEVSTHRWLRLANSSDACAIANDATYGWDVTRHAYPDRGTYSVARASLARASLFPDPEQDQGRHEWNFALVPNASILSAVAAGHALNIPPREIAGEIEPLLTLDGAVVESVALAPDRSGDVIIRAYEAEGGRGRAFLTFPGAKEVRGVDLLYRDSELGARVTAGEGGWRIDFNPFEIVTLRVRMED
ncbi:MAG: glycoside hydrolase family 38 C-terminal domain-containing protein [Actinomycetaceae bacterium]|nr:glycoside hydrolase family 38 C-terminal domain-containing protein [Actinomycetaceae bacterium]